MAVHASTSEGFGGKQRTVARGGPPSADGTFFARHADSFKYEGRFYNLILAIDGKAASLKLYPDLSRQSKTQSGLRFSDQRGVILCSLGIRVCQYNQILDHQGMNGWSELAQGLDHFSLFIDGPFELVTNRNLPAQSTHRCSKIRNS